MALLVAVLVLVPGMRMERLQALDSAVLARAGVEPQANLETVPLELAEQQRQRQRVRESVLHWDEPVKKNQPLTHH
jgi:hypothetical protein